MSSKRIVLVGSWALSGLFACSATSKPQQKLPPKMPAEVSTVAQPNMPDGHPDLSTLNVLSRGPRRLSVDQLERSIEKVANVPVGTVKLPDSLAIALGRPDYLRVTDESLDPSPLFMKFMMDLSGYVCGPIYDGDAMRPQNQRALNRFSDRTQNIRFLLLRYTGLEGSAADPYVPRLMAAYDAGASGALGDKGGWEAVCTSLFTSPEFLLY
jgi:hypothetical protein